jgi:hypothetical protein
MEIWNNYMPGDLRVHNGTLWSCHTPAWCQTEPGGPNSDLGWDNKGMCSGGTGTGGSGGAGGASGVGGSGGKGGSTGAGGSCSTTSGTTTGSAGRGGSAGAGGRGGAAGSGTGGAGGGTGSCVLDTLLPQGATTFAAFFDSPPWQGHQRNPVFADGYNQLCKAIAMYPGFASFGKGGTADQNKSEVAAFFANVAEETAYLEKPVQDVGVTDPTYKGRGSIQITGQAIYQDADAFLNAGIAANPDKVGTDPILVWATGLWYWMKHGNPSAGSPQICHDSILAGQFGHTVRIIKGDCGSSDSRANHYKQLCMTMSITPGNVTCQ